jgi:hypothetical protein
MDRRKITIWQEAAREHWRGDAAHSADGSHIQAFCAWCFSFALT